MISSKKNSEIEQQRIDLAINTRSRSAASDNASLLVLPYDPTNPPDVDPATQVIADNLLDNSDFDFSRDDYINNPPVGGDPTYECYNFYRQRFIKLTDVVATSGGFDISSAAGKFAASYTYPMDFVLLNGKSDGQALSGTLTRTSDTAAVLSVESDNNITDGVLWFGETLAEDSAHALKSVTHSLYAANEGVNGIIPIWDRVNGWGEMGTDTDGDAWDMATPLPVNLVRGGIRYHFRIIVALRDGAASSDPVRVYAGVWDATVGQTRFLESSNMTLDVSPVGTLGGTTYDYVVIAELDDGTTIYSDVTTIVNGNATLSPAHYNRLTWANATGVLNFKIYRRTGGVVKRIFTIRNGGHDYNDYGTDEGETLGSLPSGSSQRPVVYRLSPSFALQTAGAWRSVDVTLDVPGTYNTAQTTGKQWLRFGIEGVMADQRAMLFDRLLFSTSNGGWDRSARDKNKIANQNPTSLPPSTGQGGTGIEPGCFTLDTPVLVCDSTGSDMRSVPIAQVVAGETYVFSGARKIFKVVAVMDGEASEIVQFTLENGLKFNVSTSERFITSRADKRGTRIDDLTLGDTILCHDGKGVATSRIVEYGMIGERTRVRTLTLAGGGHTFVVTNGSDLGAIAHNRKQEEP